MQVRLLPLVSSICLTLSGCSAYTANPLYTDKDAVVEPGLEGTWVPSDPNEKSEFLIQKAGDHQYTLTISAPDENLVQTYKVNLVRLGGHLFADLIYDSETAAGKQIDDPLGVVSMHAIVRLEVAGDQLSYAALDSDSVEKQNAQEPTPLKLVSVGDQQIITDETDVLRAYITVHALDRFSDEDHLKRKLQK